MSAPTNSTSSIGTPDIPKITGAAESSTVILQPSLQNGVTTEVVTSNSTLTTSASITSEFNKTSPIITNASDIYLLQTNGKGSMNRMNSNGEEYQGDKAGTYSFFSIVANCYCKVRCSYGFMQKNSRIRIQVEYIAMNILLPSRICR